MASEPQPDAATQGTLGPGGVRALKIAIAAMGVMIALGLIAVLGRIFVLAAGPSGPGVAATSANGRRAAITPALRAELPAGASVRTMALGGDRLALHYDAPSGGGVLIVDVATGAVISRIELVPAPPRN